MTKSKNWSLFNINKKVNFYFVLQKENKFAKLIIKDTNWEIIQIGK